jgi:hypothetical protein
MAMYRSNCAKILPGAFAFHRAPFAVHALDRERAFKYLQCCIDSYMTWADAEEQIRAYLSAKNVTPAIIDAEVERARALLQPWLD